MEAAQALNKSVLNPEFVDVLNSYKRMRTDDERVRYADHFLARTAGMMDQIWPTMYELLKLVEERELFRQNHYRDGEPVTFDSFAAYFEAFVGKPFETWAELESTYQYAHKFMPKLLAGGFAEAKQERRAAEAQAKDAEDRAEQRPPGGNNGNQYTGGNVDNIHVAKRPTGTSESAALRRLRKDHPDLHAQVLNGEVSAHAAAVQAGFRPRTCTIRTDKPESIVGTLRRQLDPEVLSMVAKLLTESEV